MESNEDKPFSNRIGSRNGEAVLIKRGISWRISGAERMGKAIQLVNNGELESFYGRKCSEHRFALGKLSFDLFLYPPEYEYSVSMPVFSSSDSTRLYAKMLRDLTKNDYPII